MPSKNKNIIRRSKTRKQHRSRKHKRNNNNARNQTIRGGWRWPWRRPTPTLIDRIKQRNPGFQVVESPNPRSSQPRLPTNVRVVTAPLREEVSKEKRDRINDLKKHVEPLIKQRDELVVKKQMLEERLANPKETSRENRRQIREEIARIRSEIREIETEIRPILREIERAQVKDREYREKYGLPELPIDDIPNASTEMAKVDDAAGVYGVHLGKKAFGAELELRAQSRTADANQAELIEAMNRMSVHRDSPSGSLTREPSRRSSTPRRDSSARGSRRSPSP